MAKKTDQKDAADVAASQAQAAAEPAAEAPVEFTPEQKQAYALAVIRKQAGVDDAGAAQLAEKLGPEKLTQLHDAGREGRVADCRALLGL